jgi:hypothetical protein
MASTGRARFSASIWLRGVMMSSTEIFSRSNRLSRMLLCFCGMKLPPSSTTVRSFLGDRRCWWALRAADAQRAQDAETNRLTNQIAGLASFISGRSTRLVPSEMRSGIGGADHLRRDLGEHDQQEGHAGGGDRDHAFLVAEEQDRDRRDQGGGHGIDQGIRDQHQRQQLVGAVEQPQRGDGAAVPRLARWRRRYLLAAIRAVSAIAKKAEQRIRRASARNCTQNGTVSKGHRKEAATEL